jgi:hypothetical protein
MRVVISAVARYRFTLIVRRARWMVPLLMFAILVPLMATADWFVASDSLFYALSAGSLRDGAAAMLWTYMLHTITLVMLCASFGVAPARPEGASPSDLMDTAPISGYVRFSGDALGIFAATMSLHYCVLPLLAHSIAATSFPLRLFWWLELLMIPLLLFVSCASSWTMRAQSSRWSQTRTLRAGATMLILLALILAATVRPRFAESVAMFLSEPSPMTLHGVAAMIHAPLLFTILLAAMVAGFTIYYSVQTARAIERT